MTGLNRFLARNVYNGALSDLSLATNPWTLNRYAFAAGNPINRSEVDGHCWQGSSAAYARTSSSGHMTGSRTSWSGWPSRPAEQERTVWNLTRQPSTTARGSLCRRRSMFNMPSASVMAGPGACLVPASPLRPAQPVVEGMNGVDDQSREQAADLVDRQRN